MFARDRGRTWLVRLFEHYNSIPVLNSGEHDVIKRLHSLVDLCSEWPNSEELLAVGKTV